MKGMPGYVVGLEALDIARMTGLPLAHVRRSRQWEEPEIGALAADHMVRTGEWSPGDLILDLTRLPWWDRWKVAWTRICAYYWLEENPWN